jgi:hypothetical protein
MSTPKVFTAGEAIPEQSSAQYACTFVDATGAAITGASISAIVATLRAVGGAVINSRNAQSVLNVNGGSLTGGGAFTLVLSALDTVAVGTQTLQERMLTLEVTFTSGTLTHEVRYYVRQLDDVS